jgi:hypothetical protein
MSSFDNQFRTPASPSGINARSFDDDPYIGFDLDGQYRIIALIGSGGWGNVYRAEHTTLGSDLAVKVIHKHHLQDERSLKRFELEAKLLMRLESPYVVKIIDHGFSPAPYIVMEYCDGQPLHKLLKANGPMDFQLAIELFLQLCDGLSAAEAIRIVHRDLKPANIMIMASGGKVQSKILDFGLAKFVDQSTGADKLTSTGDVLGSPPYMSPEQWKGQCDHRSDIYSLGCIMYEVLAGRPAFSAEYGLDYLNKHLSEKPKSISEVNESGKVPQALEDVISKCMQKLPANRYQSAAACKADLRKIKVGRKPFILLAENARTVATKRLVVSAVVIAATIAAAFCLKEPIIHAVCAQLYTQADTNLSMGKSDDAIAQYRQILSLSQMLPNKDLQRLRALQTLSALLRDRRELTASASLQRQVDYLTGSADTNAELEVLLHKINKTIDTGNLAEAQAQGKTALDLARASLSEHSLGYATCLELVGDIAARQAAYGKAADSYRQSLALAQEFLEPKALRKAEIMDKLAMALKGAGNAEESEKYLALSQALKGGGQLSNGKPLPNPLPATAAIDKANIARTAQDRKSSQDEKTSPIKKPSGQTGPLESPAQRQVISQTKPAVHQKVSESRAVSHALSGSLQKQKIQAKQSSAAAQPHETVPSASQTAKSKSSHSQSSSGWSEMEKLRVYK